MIPAAALALGSALAGLAQLPLAAGAAAAVALLWLCRKDFATPEFSRWWIPPVLVAIAFLGPAVPPALLLGTAGAGVLALGARRRAARLGLALVCAGLAGSAAVRARMPDRMFLSYLRMEPGLLDFYYRPLVPPPPDEWEHLDYLRTPAGDFFIGGGGVFHSDGGRLVENPMAAPLRFAQEVVSLGDPGGELAVVGLITRELCHGSGRGPVPARLFQVSRFFDTPACGTAGGPLPGVMRHRLAFPPYNEALTAWLSEGPGEDGTRWLCVTDLLGKRAPTPLDSRFTVVFRSAACEVFLGKAVLDRIRSAPPTAVMRRYLAGARA